MVWVPGFVTCSRQLGTALDRDSNRLDWEKNRPNRDWSRNWMQNTGMNNRRWSHRDKSSASSTPGPDQDTIDHNNRVSSQSWHILHNMY